LKKNIAHILKNTGPSGALNEFWAKRLLREYGIPTVAETIAHDTDSAAKAAREIGFPVVLKGLGSSFLHKTEQGLVHLNLTDEDSVREAARRVMERAGSGLEGLLIQPHIAGTRELAAGVFHDAQFGPTLMFGLGGIFAEALSDVSFRLSPLTERDAAEMIREIRGRALLDDFRGERAVDRRELIQTLMNLSQLALDLPEIAEIDINPLRVGPDGRILAVDALVVVRKVPPIKEFPPAVDPRLLGRLFHPRSVAFVGASSQLGKWGHVLLSITIASGFEGEIHMVNPKGGIIAGRTVFPSVTDIPGPVDLAVVTIPAAGVADLIPEFAHKGVKNMLLITSGFAETGDEGRRLEKELMEKARNAGILILGPNTMGICNPHIRLYCTGSHVWPKPGDTAVVAQSGNMGSQFLAFAEKQGIGVRAFAGSGNEAMITIEDYLEAFEVDQLTRNVMLYVESVKNGRRFFETSRRLSKTKPIVLMKGGRTAPGTRAAATHTGALASNARVFNAVCRQAGIVQADYPTELLDLAAAFSSLPLPRGNRAAIMTLGGGWGVVTADLCAEFNLEVPELPQDLIAEIDKYLPPYWSRTNPVDIVGEHGDAVAVNIMKALMAWDGCDAVINLGLIGRKILLGRIADSVQKADPSYSPEFLNQIRQKLVDFEQYYIELIAELMTRYNKPVYGVSLSFSQDEQTVFQTKKGRFNGVFYPTPERAVKSFSRMWEYHRFVAGS
jgi:acyl-CoA synthetase (NDP forming)